jgi:transmembrane protein 222
LDTSQTQTTERRPTQVKFTPSGRIDPDNARFPFCIVWTPLPLITWFLPFIGHTGIALSDGVIHDFAGPYTITIDDLAFGETHKYVPLDIKDPVTYDRSVIKADKIYSEMMHNICCNNCHSHVARALNKYQYRGRDDYTMVDVWWMCCTQSRYVSWAHVAKTYLGFIIMVALIAFIVLI